MGWFDLLGRFPDVSATTTPGTGGTAGTVGDVAQEDTGHVIRLLYGEDARHPRRVLDISGTVATDNYFLRDRGFAPAGAQRQVIYGGGADGQRRLDSSQANMEFSITYDLNANSVAQLGQLQREINRFRLEVQQFEEGGRLEPVWLEYRWADNLAALPRPAVGQLSHYLRVLDLQVAAWPGELHRSGRLVAGQIENISLDFVVEPYSQGLKEKVFRGIGHIEMDDNGVLVVGASLTNFITNPSFGHSTWNTGWSVSNAALIATQETREDFTRSFDSAAHLVNTHASIAYNYTQTLTLTAADYVISCYARRPDGAAVTSSDIQMVGQGAAQTTTFVQVNNSEWYFCYAVYTAAASSSTHGVQVKASAREIIIDDIQITLEPTFTNQPVPLIRGDKLGCTWSGTAHNSSSTQSTHGRLNKVLTTEMSGEYTLTGWITPYWNSTDYTSVVVPICGYQLSDSSKFTRLRFNATNPRVEIWTTQGGTTYTGAPASNLSWSYGDSLHIALVRNIDGLEVYVNGTSHDSITQYGDYFSDGVLSLGSYPGTTAALNGAVDGWRVFRQALTATQINTLYNNERHIKTAYKQVGTPPYLWTRSTENTNSFDNADDTSSRQNWGIVGGVPGDDEAKCEWRITPDQTTQQSDIWLGRLAVDTTKEIDPADTLFWEFTGAAAADATYTGNDYNLGTVGLGLSTVVQADNTLDEADRLRGRFRVAARVYMSDVSDTTEIRAVYDFGNSAYRPTAKYQAITTATTALLLDAGELFFNWPSEDVPTTVKGGLEIKRAGTTVTYRVDFLQLVPYPYCRVYKADNNFIAASTTLYISDTQAWVMDAAGSLDTEMVFEGAPVTVLPRKLNYIIMLQGSLVDAFDITDTATVELHVTPRWILTGPPVG